MGAVSFTIGDGLDGESVARGRVSFGGVSVALELDGRGEGDNQTEPRKVVIGVEEFASCRFRRGLLGDRLELRTIEMGALGGVPGALVDAVTLRFARRDRDAAEALAQRLTTVLTERAAARAPMARVASSDA